MPASVTITENKRAALSAEALPSGNFELRLEAKKVFAANEIESAAAVLNREDLTKFRDSLTALLER